MTKLDAVSFVSGQLYVIEKLLRDRREIYEEPTLVIKHLERSKKTAVEILDGWRTVP